MDYQEKFSDRDMEKIVDEDYYHSMEYGSMTTRPFKQVDVFTNTAYLGNPLAVVLDGSGLSTHQMQQFAHWTNLSETTFVLPPTVVAAAQGADYQVRIFTPGGELPFAGHPTLGTCHAWMQAGGKPRSNQQIVQECAKGLITIRQEGSRLAFTAPTLKRSTPEPTLVSAVAAALGLDHSHIITSQLLDNGPMWLALLTNSPDAMLALEPDHAALKRLGQDVGVAYMESASNASNLIVQSNFVARAFSDRSSVAKSAGVLPQAQVRVFVASAGVYEDPVTGSLNASLAQWLIADGLAPTSYIATQGTRLGRHGQVFVSQDTQGQVWVGGDVVTCVDGVVSL
jgi:PhzF family phenazine biosynthesis protein